MEFSGGIQFGGGMQLTAPPTVTQTYTWLLSENATSNWGTNNKILVNTILSNTHFSGTNQNFFF